MPFDADDESRFLNRELSWLDFNARVVALAEDDSRPLLERAKFLAIFAANLDEFFQVRVSGLAEQANAGLRTRSPDGLEPAAAIREIRDQVRALMERQATVFTKDIAPALEDAGIRFPEWADLDDDDRRSLARMFDERVYPVLTPLAVDPAHPFPYISNLSLNLAAVVRDPASGETRFARVKVPPALPRFIPLPDGERFVALETLIAAHLDRLFPGMEILGHHPFRVTRDADFELDDENEDLLEAIESVLHRRRKFGEAVRLEVDASMSDEVLDVLCRELELAPAAVVVVDGPLDLSGLLDVYALDRPELKDEP
jgi:polyphosphate kinase